MATLSDVYTHLKTLCEQWFYNKSEMDTSLNGKVDKETGKGLSTNDYTTAEKNKLSGIEAQANKTVVDTAMSSSSTNPVQNKIITTALGYKVDKVNGKGLSTNDFTSAYKTKLDNLDTNLTSKNVTVEKLATAETGYLTSYIVKQNGTQVGNTINIPKDFLVKSGEVKTVTVEDQPVTGYHVGDKYIDLVINTKDSSGTDEHIYILVSDLIANTVDWSDITNKPSTFAPSSHSHGAVTNDGCITSFQQELLGYVMGVVSPVQQSGQNCLKVSNSLSASILKDSNAHTNIDSSANNTQAVINTKIDTALGNKASSTHTHGNINNSGEITTTGTSGGNMLVTNASNKIVVDTTINVIDALLQDLISYGSS